MNNSHSGVEAKIGTVIVPAEAYISPEYARAEGEKLWPKVWQIACRVEELESVGDYVTYDILDESIIVVRSAVNKISAYYNVCQHRGRRLTEGCGHSKRFYCRFHGWSWNLDGSNHSVLDEEDWGGTLDTEDIRLPAVKADTWGGWVWINMDPDSESLAHFLGEAKGLLDPFDLDKMRFKWRQWLYFPCNWKTALEAFSESYHVHASHPQLNRWVSYKNWSRAVGLHGHHGVLRPRDSGDPQQGGSGFLGVNVRGDADARVAAIEQIEEMVRTLDATTPRGVVDAARRLIDELPEGTSAADVSAHLMASARRDDEARGIHWPEITPEQLQAAGYDWHLFPNSVVLPSLTSALCYRARPNGYDPDSCIFEVCALERFAEGEAPETEWVYEPDQSEEKWRLILTQDFSNMPEVQRGMKSKGYSGARTNPVEEVAISHFHEVLSRYMGIGAPSPVKQRDSQ
ncbi:aromatic ring-hydroxylating dioxygenase subunit alpha [Halioxenophilus sp. WMMB6]|uniref:aromatic ring-hydroxylating oxygenase subunit alpha n=1 Tax=Halioxenophilus sp. WMMB6 TaxID=3073815 RepID=UPI00295F189E|nr:aromatic ring-hydroxylating dioxygenase subunit alpha [Halioxenophilus sp. WMMB6]